MAAGSLSSRLGRSRPRSGRGRSAPRRSPRGLSCRPGPELPSAPGDFSAREWGAALWRGGPDRRPSAYGGAGAAGRAVEAGVIGREQGDAILALEAEPGGGRRRCRWRCSVPGWGTGAGRRQTRSGPGRGPARVLGAGGGAGGGHRGGMARAGGGAAGRAAPDLGGAGRWGWWRGREALATVGLGAGDGLGAGRLGAVAGPRGGGRPGRGRERPAARRAPRLGWRPWWCSWARWRPSTGRTWALLLAILLVGPGLAAAGGAAGPNAARRDPGPLGLAQLAGSLVMASVNTRRMSRAGRGDVGEAAGDVRDLLERPGVGVGPVGDGDDPHRLVLLLLGLEAASSSALPMPPGCR